MEKKLNNKNIIMISVIIIFLIILIPSCINVYNNHRKKLYNSVIDNAKYQALKCFREDNCSETITLKELYELKYLDQLVNPLTKEIYNENTTFDIKNGTVTFNG